MKRTYINNFIIKCKWVFLRHKAKCRRIRMNKSALRLYYIQQLENKHGNDMLIKHNYKKLRHMFIQEFPNRHPFNHNEKFI